MEPTIGLPEASKMAALSQTTIRRWIKSGELEARLDETGKWKLNKKNFLEKLARHQPRKAASVSPPTGERPEDSPLYLHTLEALQRERKLNDELRAENKKLHAEIKEFLTSNSDKKEGLVGALSRWIRT